MPYSASFRFVPEAGHQSGVGQAIEDAARRYQTGSLRVSVVSELAGRDQAAVTGFFHFETLSEYHDFPKSPNDHQVKASQDLQTALRGIVRDSSSSIMEIIMPLQSPLRRDGYAQIVTLMPLPGKTNEVSELTQELGRVLLAQGHNAAVSLQLSGPNAGESALTTGFAALEEWEKFRSDSRTNADIQKAQEPFGPVLAAPATITLYSIVILVPPRDHTFSDA